MKKTLKVKTVSQSGVFGQPAYFGGIYADVNNNQIAIQVDHTSGNGAFKHDVEHKNGELINVTFEDNSMWSGSFEDLKKALFRPAVKLEDSQVLEVAIGQKVGELLNVKFNKTTGRCQLGLGYGTKSVRGLGAVIERIVMEETERITSK